MLHGAGVILVRKDGAVLMQHRDEKSGIFYPDYWVYPEGGVEEGENYLAAATRELEEETGYVAEELQPLIDESYIRPDGSKVNRHVFWAIYDEKQKINCFEGQEMKFVMADDFTGKKLIPGQERLFMLAINLAFPD